MSSSDSEENQQIAVHQEKTGSNFFLRRRTSVFGPIGLKKNSALF
jgi:hypothetical protein